MFCEKCGTELTKKFKTCPVCGNSLVIGQKYCESEEVENKDSKRIVALALGILSIALALPGGFLMIGAIAVGIAAIVVSIRTNRRSGYSKATKWGIICGIIGIGVGLIYFATWATLISEWGKAGLLH